jgi:subtilisin family serine protease
MRTAVAAAAVALALAGTASGAASFAPNDPLAAKQWHLTANRTFDAWAEPPLFEPVVVAVLDSGVDGTHPDLVNRIVGSRSFVGGSALRDHQGHGTFVAGLIAAEVGNGIGIAGMAPNAELLIAKVVRDDRTIPLDAEAKAIRWAVEQGAQVINLSLGGVRDPVDSRRDTFSRAEAAAIAHARKNGVVVVAAVGNGDQAPAFPWRYASYPAALPHVIGVSALTRADDIPPFSNRDSIYNDLAAPGEAVYSTLPRAMTSDRPTCVQQGYSECGPPDYRMAEGTSFAAPQVAAAAALLLGLRPWLTPDQVASLLTRSAADMTPGTGCARCTPGRDAFSGWGRLDVAEAVAALNSGLLPPSDAYEANDDAGADAFPLWGTTRRVTATLDYWDDNADVYAVKLTRGQRVTASLDGPSGTDANLVLWRPGTTGIANFSRTLVTQRAAQSAKPGSRERLTFRATAPGWYYLEVRMSRPGSGAYDLTVAKR